MYSNNNHLFTAHFPTNELISSTVVNSVAYKGKALEYRIDETSSNELTVNPTSLPSPIKLEAYGRWHSFEYGRLYFGMRILPKKVEPFLCYIAHSKYDKLWTELDLNVFMQRYDLRPLLVPCV